MGLTVLAIIVVAVVAVSPMGRRVWRWGTTKIMIQRRLSQYGPAARERLHPHFQAAGVMYPPSELVLIGIKDTNTLELWAPDESGSFALVRAYPILAASGQWGPKLRRGDCQVPEGIYEIESLNPNSAFHLSLRVNYPNAFDRERGREDDRNDLGSDIMIHGSNVSVGCLAMGDEVVEELFVLASDAGLESIQVILTPVDFRTTDLPADSPTMPDWTTTLYSHIRVALERVTPTTGTP
jgi:hypothetical protein